MNKREQSIRNLTTRPLAVRASSIDESTKSFEAVLSTERPVAVFDFREGIIDEVLVARGASFPDQVPFLDSHSQFGVKNVLGSVRNITTRGIGVNGRVFMAEDVEDSEDAFRKVVQGHITDVSVGYRTNEFTDIAPRKRKRVGGKFYTAGDRTLRITTKWEMREVSLVPIGADDQAKIRSANVMNDKLRKFLESVGLPLNSATADAWKFRDELKGPDRDTADGLIENDADDSADAKPPQGAIKRDDPVDDDDAVRAAGIKKEDAKKIDADEREKIRKEAVTEECNRRSEIRELAGSDVPRDVMRKALDEQWSISKASRVFLEAVRSSRADPVHGPGIHTRVDNSVGAVAAGMMHRAGVSVIDPNAPDYKKRDQERMAEAGERYRDLSLVDYCREALRIADRPIPHSMLDIIRAASSTAAMTSIFSSTANLSMMKGYTETEDSTRDWVSVVSVPDFKTNERVLLDKVPTLTKHARGGTAEHITRSDVVESYKVGRYSAQFVLDEQDIIDDSMNAMSTTPAEMGRAAARIRPDLVYAILFANASLGADSVALFNQASHGNFAETGGTFDADALKTTMIAMTKQTQNGVQLNLRAKFLILAPKYQFDAAILLKSAQNIIASDSGGTFNPLQNSMELRVENRISSTGVVDPATGTTQAVTDEYWYLVADPAAVPTIEVGYLRGNSSPTMTSFSFNGQDGKWGIQWSVKIDVGAKALDYRGLGASDGTT